MIKGFIQGEDVTIVNIYAPNTGAPRYIQQILTDINGEIDGNTIKVGDFNTPLTSMDRSSRQKTNKATEIDHILGHKANRNKFRSVEIISSMFSDHNAMKLEINHGKSKQKNLLHGD